LQARYALCLLFEYAATLGLLDVAYIPPHDARPDYRGNWGTDDLPFLSRYDGLLYFRINPLGRLLPGVGGSLPTGRAGSRLPDAGIAGAAESGDRRHRHVAWNQRIACCWTVMLPRPRTPFGSWTRLVCWKRLEEGHDMTVLAELLVSLSGQPLPETVERFLEDMTRRARSLKTTGTARLVECADRGTGDTDRQRQPHQAILPVGRRAASRGRHRIRGPFPQRAAQTRLQSAQMSDYFPENPLIVQSDQTVLLEVHSPAQPRRLARPSRRLPS
jgi:hypothetical protein